MLIILSRTHRIFFKEWLKNWLLSIDMKTKVVQHVEIERLRLKECESVIVREWLFSIDMKTKVVQHVKSEWKSEMRVWECESVRVRECKSERVKEWERVRVRKCSWFPAFVWRSDIFLWDKHLNDLGRISTWSSDIKDILTRNNLAHIYDQGMFPLHYTIKT